MKNERTHLGILTQKHGKRLRPFKYFRQLNPVERGHPLYMRAISAVVDLLKIAEDVTLGFVTIYVPHSVELLLKFHHNITLLME